MARKLKGGSLRECCEFEDVGRPRSTWQGSSGALQPTVHRAGCNGKHLWIDQRSCMQCARTVGGGRFVTTRLRRHTAYIHASHIGKGQCISWKLAIYSYF